MDPSTSGGRAILSGSRKAGRRDSEASSPTLPPLVPRPRLHTGTFAPWRSTQPAPGESERWQSFDGRWISIALGTGAALGTMIVADSKGRYESVESYETALSLAGSWRAEL